MEGAVSGGEPPGKQIAVNTKPETFILFKNFCRKCVLAKGFVPTLATKLSSILLPPVGTLSAREEEGAV